MKVYLAGFMSGDQLEECTSWRLKIRKNYENWKGAGVKYPIDFLDPFNGPEIESIKGTGLASVGAMSNAIYNGDMMSVKSCDIIIANLDNFGSPRELVGTYFELGWQSFMQKPFILIAPEDKQELCAKHPFLNRAVGVYASAQELLDSKILNFFYKRIVHANYEIEDKMAKR